MPKIFRIYALGECLIAFSFCLCLQTGCVRAVWSSAANSQGPRLDAGITGNVDGQTSPALDQSFFDAGVGASDARRDVTTDAGYVLPMLNFSTISAGSQHTCAISPSGGLYCWGRNDEGELGLGNNVDQYVPTQVGTTHDWQTVSAGLQYTCAIKTSGSLWCFGNNNYRQLGDGSGLYQRSLPTQVGTDQDWQTIAAGYDHSCGIKLDGSLWCWGRNNNYQLGDGTNVDKTVPIKIGTALDWKSIVTRGMNGFSCGLKTNGSMWCWGSNASGVHGDGTSNNYKATPTQIGTALDWQKIIASSTSVCGIKKDGSLWCWGDNTEGQLGDGTTQNKLIPTQVSAADKWQDLDGGFRFTCALKTDGSLWCWGANNQGQLGIGLSASQTLPYQVNNQTNWSAVVVGNYHGCALKTDHSLWCWGSNILGQLGDNAPTAQINTSQRITTSNDWSLINAGNEATCAIKNDHSLWCWGRNMYGALGDQTMQDKPLPTKIGADTDWQNISAGNSISCGLKLNSSLWCAGIFVGDGSTVNQTSFTNIAAAGVYREVAAGKSGSACAIKNDNTLWCWGINSSGQLGDASKTNKYVPTAISGGGTWQKIDVGQYHACAIKADGAMWCWGLNSSGQLGSGSSNYSEIAPVQAGSDLDWSTIACGENSTCALKNDHTLWCWGQLDSSFATVYSTPHQMNADTDWQTISAGRSTCAIKADKTLWCSGYGDQGIFKKFNADNDWKMVTVGNGHICASKTDDSLWCWGRNDYLQTGVCVASPKLIAY